MDLDEISSLRDRLYKIFLIGDRSERAQVEFAIDIFPSSFFSSRSAEMIPGAAMQGLVEKINPNGEWRGPYYAGLPREPAYPSSTPVTILRVVDSLTAPINKVCMVIAIFIVYHD